MWPLWLYQIIGGKQDRFYQITNQSKNGCKIQVHLFVNYSFFLCVLLFVHSYFRSFVQFFCLNSGVYSFLLVFVPSLAFLFCFIFISAVVSSYSFYFLHVLAQFIYRSFSVKCVTAFWSALSAVLFSLLLVSLFALFAVRFEAVISGRNNVSVLHSRRIFGLLFIYCNFFCCLLFQFQPTPKVTLSCIKLS